MTPAMGLPDIVSLLRWRPNWFARGATSPPRMNRPARLPRVFVVDPDQARRAGLSALLAKARDIELVGTASGAAIAQVLLRALGPAQPDAVLVAADSATEDAAAIVTAVLAQHPSPQVWGYAPDPTRVDAGQLRAVGARGILTEQTLLDDFRKAWQGS